MASGRIARSWFPRRLQRFSITTTYVPFRTLLMAGRLPIVGLGVLLCAVVLLAKRLYGWQAGLVSIALCALSPNVIAHSRLITTDLAVSFFLIATLLALDRHLETPTSGRLVLTGVLAGLTLASKFSAIVLLSVYPILFVLAGQVVERRPGRRMILGLAAGGVWYAGSAIWIHPSHLAYFNELGAGRRSTTSPPSTPAAACRGTPDGQPIALRGSPGDPGACGKAPEGWL